MRIVSADEAAAEILAVASLQPALRFPLAAALGHVLAEDIVADIALPPWTNASMDGYAVRAADILGATPDRPARLRVTSAIAAGHADGASIGPGEAARIFTGAPIPAGADSVVRQEDTQRDDDVVVVQRDRDASANVRAAGGDVARGACALPARTVIGPHQLALLAALGISQPMVHRGPRVAIISTGDELCTLDHPDEISSGRRLADVNSPALAALVAEAGGVATALGIAPDDADALQTMIESAGDADVIITAGGVSVGDHDHVREVMRARGATMRFDRVRMRPGGPTALAMLPDGRPWLALPGNPVSAMVTFELFARPAIRAMAGRRDPLRERFGATLISDAPRDATLEQYLRCVFASPTDDGRVNATLTGPQGSGMLTSMARADGLIVIPAGSGVVSAGNIVTALRFA